MAIGSFDLARTDALPYRRVLEAVRENPGAVAIDTGSEEITYAEFAESINAAAGALSSLSLPRQSRIGLVADKRPSTYAWYFAGWHKAHAVVPLGPRNPVAFNIEISRSADLAAVVVDAVLHPALAEALLDSGIPVVDPARPAGSTAVPPETAAADDVAYILFTSGSTGRPKGVRVTQGNVAAYLDVVVPRGDLGPGMRLSHTFALTFDPSVYDMLAAFTTGSTLVVPRNRELLAPASYVRARGITHWYSVPSLVAYARRSGTLRPDSMPMLRQSLFIGEPLPQNLAAGWAAAAPHSALRNVYGPTELTVSCVEYELPADPAGWAATSNGTVPVGTVYPGLQWRLIDDGRVSDREGELCVRGAQRFPGYLSPSDNPRRFFRIAAREAEPVQEALGEVPAEYWYRTGDRIRVSDGQLLHLGRIDRQVKVDGYRIELADVEHKLARHPDVFDAAALTVPDRDGGLQIRAAVTGKQQPYAEMRSYLLEVMPAYMVPADIRWLDTVPLNGSGKVDYLALRDILAGDA